jgi:hypothetical protein
MKDRLFGFAVFEEGEEGAEEVGSGVEGFFGGGEEVGERYFHATTLDKIDQLLPAEHAVKQTLNVEVVTLA